MACNDSKNEETFSRAAPNFPANSANTPATAARSIMFQGHSNHFLTGGTSNAYALRTNLQSGYSQAPVSHPLMNLDFSCFSATGRNDPYPMPVHPNMGQQLACAFGNLVRNYGDNMQHAPAYSSAFPWTLRHEPPMMLNIVLI